MPCQAHHRHGRLHCLHGSSTQHALHLLACFQKTSPSSTLVMCRLGYKVALVDADIGLRNLDLLLGLENRVLYTAIDILDGECRCVQLLWLFSLYGQQSVYEV